MASLNSISGTLSSTASLRGFGGLSSGLDRDSLIESLTYGTRSKIEAQKAKQDKLGWEQTTLRSIIDKVYNFSNTFNSYSSTTNIGSSAFFARNSITTSGENSKYVTATGTATSAELMSIVGVKQLAEDAKLTGSSASTATMHTGEIDFSKQIDINNLDGAVLEVAFGSGTSSITYDVKINLDMEKYYAAADDAGRTQVIVDAINDALKEHTTVINTTLDDYVKATVATDGTLQISGSGGGNDLKITGGSAMKALGWDEEEIDFSNNMTKDVDISKVISQENVATYLVGKTMTFSYNGTNKDITFTDEDSITDMASLQKALQSKLDSAFGKGRIAVLSSAEEIGSDVTMGTLAFKTVKPNGEADTTSTLSITGGASGLFGEKGALGIEKGDSNRVSLSKSFADSGLAGIGDIANDGAVLIINDKTFSFMGEDEKGNAKPKTIQEVMDEINASGIGVTISYQQNSDRFIISSNEKGASGKITVEGSAARAMFGADMITAEGKDAIIAVQYAGDSTVTEIIRGTNSFTMDGLTLNVNGTFGYQEVKDENGVVTGMERIEGTEAVTFNAKANVDNIVKGITDMVNAYNEIVSLINSELKTKPDKDYSAPLTGTQKEDMSEKEIEEYEKKAKQGLLFGDNDLRSFATELRYVLTGTDVAAFAEIGITESSEYSDNGKLVIDEVKLRAALESDPEKVSDLFTSKKDTAGTSGLMENMKNVMDRYCNTIGATKGLLVTRAGSEHSPLSLLDNTMKTQIDEIADYIETLLDRLESEEDRYIRQFTTLETMISQMNSQSSYLSSLNSGY